MSRNAVLIWLAIAIALGAAVVYTFWSPSKNSRGGVPAGGMVMEFDPAAVASIQVRGADGDVHVIRRAGEGDRWTLESGVGAVWPVMPTQARATVRMLSGLRAKGEAERGTGVGDRFTTVTVSLTDGSARELKLAERTLGGTALAESSVIEKSAASAGKDGTGPGSVETKRALVDATLVEVFKPASLRVWRDSAAAPGVGPDIARLTLTGPQRTITLARLKNAWHVRTPVSAPANQEKIGAALAALSRLTITDFLDGKNPEPAVTGLATPTLTIVVETDRPGAPAVEGQSAAKPAEVDRIEIKIGGPADTKGTSLFATILAPGDRAARVCAVEATGLAAALSQDPVAYIAPVATQVEPMDVGQIAVTAVGPEAAGATPPPAKTPDRVLKRQMSNWVESIAGGPEAMLADSQAKHVAEFLTMLRMKPAAAVVITPPAGYQRAADLSLKSLDGAMLDQIELGMMGTNVIMRSGDVYRAFALESVPEFAREWLVRAGAKVAPKPGAAGAEKPIDPTK